MSTTAPASVPAKTPSPAALGGKRVLVTGATFGIGYGIAAALLRAGARVAINGRRAPDAEAMAGLQALGDCVALTADMATVDGARAAVGDAYEALGGLDALVNNAGTHCDVDFLDLEESHFRRTFDLNVQGYLFASQAFARLVGQRSCDAAIVLVGSTNSLQAEMTSVCYDSSKGAILMLMRSLAVNLARRGIRVNGLGPGLIRTPLSAKGLDSDPKIIPTLQAQIPLGRIGTIDDCGGAAVFLCSDAAAYVTGQMLYVDGGIVSQQIQWKLDLPQ